MRAGRTLNLIKITLAPARISRSLVTILALTLIQTIGAPIFAPSILTPESSGITLNENANRFLQWNSWGDQNNHNPYFSTGTSFITSNSDTIQLTTEGNSQTGYIWNTDVISSDFSVTADYYFGGRDGADGVGFVIRQLSDFPNGGTSSGSGNVHNRSPRNSLKIWFDTYQNGSEINDDHLSVYHNNSLGQETIYGGNGVSLSGTNAGDIEDGQWWTYTIKWDANLDKVFIYKGALGASQSEVASYAISGFELTSYSWGFIGETGGANNNQAVRNVHYNYPAIVTGHPQDVVATVGDTVSFSTTYTNVDLAPSTRWWESSDNGGTWSEIYGATAPTYSFVASRSMTQKRYRYSIANTAANHQYTTYSNSALLTVNPLPLGRESDTALSFNGTSQYASAPDNSVFDIRDSISIEAWVNPSAIISGKWNFVVNKESAYQLGISTTGKWAYSFNGDANAAGISTEVPVKTNEWHHIAITRLASTDEVKFYFDGYLAYKGTADGASTGQIADASTTFSIGRRASDGRYFQGQIDHVALFDSVRSVDEIRIDMNGYISPTTSGLRAYYDFNEGSGSGSTLFNRKSGASSTSDLAITGSPSWVHVAEESVTATAPYTVIKFPRTYITSTGGWKAPTSVKNFSYLIVGGGGGGGTAYDNGAGGGGGGGMVRTGIFSGDLTSPISFTIGVGGRGGADNRLSAYPGFAGGSSKLGALESLGGGGGKASRDGSSLGGSAQVGTSTATTGGGGGCGGCGGGGGGGASGNGSNASGTTNGAGGAGLSIDFLGGLLAYGSGGRGGNGSTSAEGVDGTYLRGYGGTGGSAQSSDSGGGGNGGSGVVIIRWITAQKPTYTKPTNAYLNAGMTETFTTNVAQDSATAVLTRTFKWESTTPTANGAYTLIKQGTGAANAAFSWVPMDTTTSGSGYLYRLTVTDSDTAGLFITDSSTAYAVINRALVVSGSSSFGKTINLAKSETYTITLGTPTYRASLSQTIAGITLDTSTAGSAVIKISETMTVGTYYETLTVLDSVSASVVTPLTIIVAAPPNLVNTGEIVGDGLIFNLDFANSASFDRGTRTAKDISGSNKPITIHNSPLFKDENLGHLDLNSSSSQYVSATGFTTLSTWTIDTYFRLDSTSKYSCIVSSEGASSTATRNLALCVDATTPRIYAGFYDGVSWTYIRTTETIPLNTWTHVAAEWDGLTSNATTSVKIWINGIQATNYEWYTRGTSAAAASSNRIFINHDPVTTVSSYTDLSIGYVRIYNRALSFAEVTQNYNATKSRFLAANVDMATPSHKYGNTTTETYTITSGYGSETISYATGNKAGVKLETTTSLVTLKMQESLTATTHYETITVTDSLGASTFLPIKMTVSKADTLTIGMDTKTVVTFNNAPITSYPKPVIKGLAGLDTFTVTTKFSSSLYTKSATVPTNSDTYTVIAEDPVFGIGALSNYVNVVYETSTAVVNKAKQPALSVFLYGGTVGLPFPITVSGGGGDGAISETVTTGSSMTGCAITNHSVSAASTSQGFCRVYIFKAASQNYLSESITVDMYFMAYINNQPTGQVGSGSTIAISGVTSFETSTVTPPGVTSLSSTTISLAALGEFTINGSDFDAGGLTVKFYRNKTVPIKSSTASTITFDVSAIRDALATSGRIVVITVNGEAVSPQSLTITP